MVLYGSACGLKVAEEACLSVLAAANEAMQRSAAQQAEDLVGIGMAALAVLAVDEVTVRHHIKNPAGAGNQVNVGEAFLFQQIRQTGGARQVVSNLTVGDSNVHGTSWLTCW